MCSNLLGILILNVPQMEKLNNSSTIMCLEQVLFGLHPNAKDLYNTIALLKGQPVADDVPQPTLPVLEPAPKSLPRFETYDPDKSLQQRVVNILKEIGEFSKIAVITDTIRKYEPNFEGNLSATLTKLRQLGTVINRTLTGSRKDTEWGLIEWEGKSVNA